jgi:hypothetical protein
MVTELQQAKRSSVKEISNGQFSFSLNLKFSDEKTYNVRTVASDIQSMVGFRDF